MLGAVDDGDHDRLVVAHEVGTVNFGRLAVPFQTLEDCGAGDLEFPALFYDRLVDRPSAIAVAFREVDAQQLTGSVQPHRPPPLGPSPHPSSRSTRLR